MAEVETKIGTLRRYYLFKRITAKQQDDLALSAVWQGKQEGEPGAALPADFPHKERLAAVGYVAKEDLDFADAEELGDYVGLSRSDANEVIAAHAAL